jgi:hypothetical protein
MTGEKYIALPYRWEIASVSSVVAAISLRCHSFCLPLCLFTFKSDFKCCCSKFHIIVLLLFLFFRGSLRYVSGRHFVGFRWVRYAEPRCVNYVLMNHTAETDRFGRPDTIPLHLGVTKSAQFPKCTEWTHLHPHQQLVAHHHVHRHLVPQETVLPAQDGFLLKRPPKASRLIARLRAQKHHHELGDLWLSHP